MDFEKDFEFKPHGNKEWTTALKTDSGLGIFGWCATSDDYEAEGPIEDYLRKIGK